MKRGYFEIGIYHGNNAANVGTLWRSAWQLGACGIFTIGTRYTPQPSDTVHASRHIPLRHYEDIEMFLSARPVECPLIAIEMGGEPLRGFKHPERAIYLLGSESRGLPEHVMMLCQNTVSLEAVRRDSYNVAVAGSLVMYHRQFGAGVA